MQATFYRSGHSPTAEIDFRYRLTNQAAIQAGDPLPFGTSFIFFTSDQNHGFTRFFA